MSLLFTPTRPPRKHQADALAKARGRDSFFYQMDLGTGKSYVAWTETLQLHLEGRIDRVLIVAGAGSFGDWQDKHIPENTPEEILVLTHIWGGGSTQRERRQIQGLMDGPPALRTLIINVEAIGSSEIAFRVAKHFVTGGRTHIIVDES